MGIIEHPFFNQAAGSALIYLFICWAKKQGFNTIHFGLTRPFLNDGSLRFKRKWGIAIKENSWNFLRIKKDNGIEIKKLVVLFTFPTAVKNGG